MQLALRLELKDGIFRLQPEADISPYESVMLAMFMTVVTNVSTSTEDRSAYINDHNLGRHFQRELFN